MTHRAAGFTPVPPGAKPRLDRADTYSAQHAASRVYVAHTGADRVDVLDGASGAYLWAMMWDRRTRRLFVFRPRSCGVAIFEDA